MRENKVYVQNTEGERLAGLETFPDEKKDTYPVILLVHGFGVDKHEGGMFDRLTELLAEKGFLVYRFDFSGRGASEGDYADVTLSKLASEIQSFMKFIKAQSFVDTDRIGILAQSFGTENTIVARPDVKTIILMGTVAFPLKVLPPLFGEGYHPEGVSIRKNSSGEVIKINKGYWEDFEKHNLLEEIKYLKGPILFLHGEKDEKVPLENPEALYEAYPDVKEKIIIPGNNHGMKPDRESMHQAVLDWFTKELV